MTAVKDVAPAAAHFAAMWTYHPELLAVPVPRYTSYPTAAEFTDETLSLSGDARPYARSIAASLDDYRLPGTRQFSTAA